MVAPKQRDGGGGRRRPKSPTGMDADRLSEVIEDVIVLVSATNGSTFAECKEISDRLSESVNKVHAYIEEKGPKDAENRPYATWDGFREYLLRCMELFAEELKRKL